MIPISIDASGLLEAVNVSEEDARQFVSNVIQETAVEFTTYWSNAANVLGSSRQEYQNSIYTEKIDDLTYIVGLRGFVPNAIEQGISGFDQKIGFSKSKDRTETKDGGWYLTIPFRFANSGSVSKSPIFSGGRLPSKIQAEVDKLNVGQTLPKTKIPKELLEPNPRNRVVTKSKIFDEYSRTHSFFEGIKKTKGGVFSFRRVSSKSDSNSWIHSGISARNLSERALNNMNLERTLSAIARKYVDQL